MQFICEDPMHIGIRAAEAPVFDNDGRMIKEAKRKLSAKFERGSAPEYGYQEALKIFSFSKIHSGITPRQWVAAYDSETDQMQRGLTDEEREIIESELCKNPFVVKVEPPPVELPYPSYAKQRKTQGRRSLDIAIAEIVETVKTTGIDPEFIISYELQHEKNQKVIEAMQALKNEEPADEPMIAA